MDGGDARLRAKALEAKGGIYWWRGDFEQCAVIYKETVEMWRTLEDEAEVANALYNYALAVGYVGGDRTQAALELLEEARVIYTRLGDDNGLGNIAWGTGNVYLEEARRGRVEAEDVIHVFAEAAEYYKRAGNEFGQGWSTFEVGAFYMRTGLWSEAWEPLRDATEMFWAHRDVSGVVMSVSELAGVALGLGDSNRAYRLSGMVESLREKTGADLVIAEFNVLEGLEPETLHALKGEALAAFEGGMDCPIEEVVAYALAGPTDDGQKAPPSQPE